MKYVYNFGDGKADGKADMKNLLGGKGANLAEMNLLDIPVPPGFTLTTEVCTEYYKNNRSFPESLASEVKKSLSGVESIMGTKFGDADNPLLLSVRSGARQSMPGMMETVLNIGLTSDTIPGLIEKTNNPRFVYDAYRRLITMYSDVVMEKAAGIEPDGDKGIRHKLEHHLSTYKTNNNLENDTDLSENDWKNVIEIFKNEIIWNLNKDDNQFTFREIINKNLQKKPWLGLGINLVLGSPIDVKVDNNNLMFLPKYVEEILDKTIINENGKKEKIVIQKINLVSGDETNTEITNISFWFWLSFMFTILLLILKLDRLFKFWSSISLFGLGLLGFILLFMWFETDHQGTKNNFNLLWATPTHWLMLIFIISKKPSVFKSVFSVISLVIIFSTILFWFIIPQELHQAIKPLILQTSIIYFYYYKKNKQQLNLTETSDSV